MYILICMHIHICIVCIYVDIYDHLEGSDNGVHYYIDGGDDVVIDGDKDYNDLQISLIKLGECSPQYCQQPQHRM